MPKIQHTVIFPFKEVSEDVMAKLQGIVATFNDVKGITATFRAEVADAKSAEPKPEGDAGNELQGYNHCLMVIADDLESLKDYLHGDAHKQWGPFALTLFDEEVGMPIVFDSDLLLSDVPAGKIQRTVLYKVDDCSPEQSAKIADICGELNKQSGIQATFAPAGCGGMSLADTLGTLSWPDKTNGFTHVLTVVADDVPALHTCLSSDLHCKDFRGAVQQADGKDPRFCVVSTEWALTV